MFKTSQLLTIAFLAVSNLANCQIITWQNYTFEQVAVNADIVSFNGEQIIKIQRDLNLAPFDLNNIDATVDGPTYLKLRDFSLDNATVEVKVLSRIMDNSPFPAARGFIGIAFRIDDKNENFESIYLRPANGRSDDDLRRNRAIQYFSFPDYKFARLRRESPGLYEGNADIGLDEWIDIRMEFQNSQAAIYINKQKLPTFSVKQLLGKTIRGSIGLWVDVGTVGYFKDLKISEN